MLSDKKILLITLIVLVFSLIVFLRIWNINADPPYDLSASGGYFADEGYWTHNARNKILFGYWVSDDWNNMYVSPILNLMTYVSFDAFGVTLAAARFVPIILSIISILFLTITFCNEKNWLMLVLLLIFTGLQYPFLVYNKIAIVETPATFFLILVYFAFRLKSKKTGYFLVGFFSVSAFITKTTVIFIFPAVLLSIFYDIYKKKVENTSRVTLKLKITTEGENLIWFIAGVSIPFLAWFFGVYHPNIKLLAQYNNYYRGMLLPKTILGFIKEIITQRFPIYFNRTPVLMLLSHISIFLLFRELFRKRFKYERGEVFALFWYSFGILFLSFFHYRPLRYYVPVIPAMGILSASLLIRIIKGDFSWIKHAFYGKWKYFFLIWLLYPIVLNTGLLVDKYFFYYSLGKKFIKPWPVLSIWYPGAFIVLIFGFFLLFYLSVFFSNKTSETIQIKMMKTFFVVSMLLFLVVQSWSIFSWLYNPHYDVLKANDELAAMQIKGSFTGQWAGELCLQTKHKVIPVYPNYVNYHSPFKKYHIKYLLLWKEYHHRDNFFQAFPEQTKDACIIKKFTIKQSSVFFYRLNRFEE